MPIDKFGRHLHSAHLDPSKVLIAQDVTNITYEIMFYIMAIGTDKDSVFTLINGNSKNEYICPLSGTILHVKYGPLLTQLFINDIHYTEDSLLGITLKKGDRFKAILPLAPNSNYLFALEAVLSVPLLNNEH